MRPTTQYRPASVGRRLSLPVQPAAYGRKTYAVVLAFTLLLLPACSSRRPFAPEPTPHAGQLIEADITYREVAEGYNATVAQFDKLFLRTYVRLAWQETDGDGDTRYRSEAGDGKIMFAAPGNTVLTIEKLSRVYLWAGSNDEQYWLFDQLDESNKVAYVGHYDAAGSSDTRMLPIPFRPDAVPYLLGLVALDPALDSRVYTYDGQYLIEPAGMRMRMLIDPTSFRPTRVDLLDERGWSLVMCKLTGRFGVEVEGVPSQRWPVVCDDAELFVAGQASNMSIELIHATNNPRRVRDQLFDLDVLMEALKPDALVDLDAR